MPHLEGVILFMTSKTIRFFAFAIVLGLLAGCQEDELARPVSGEKGVYSGKVDETLSEETREKLRRRMIIQRGGGV